MPNFKITIDIAAPPARFPPAMWRVMSLEEGRGFVWKSGMPGMWVTAHHVIEPTAAGSRVTLALDYAGWLGRILARRTRELAERYLALEANGLRTRSERIP